MDWTDFQCTTHWHLQRGTLGSEPKKQQISGVPVPGSGMDTPSPWRQGPDWEAGNITAMEKCIVGEERQMKRDRKLQIARQRRCPYTSICTETEREQYRYWRNTISVCIVETWHELDFTVSLMVISTQLSVWPMTHAWSVCSHIPCRCQKPAVAVPLPRLISNSVLRPQQLKSNLEEHCVVDSLFTSALTMTRI